MVWKRGGALATNRSERHAKAVASSAVHRRFLRLADVVKRINISRATIYRLIATGQFPLPVKLSERTSVWIDEEVESFCQRRVEARDAARTGECL